MYYTYNIYSGILLHGHPQKVVIYATVDTLFGLKCIYMFLYNLNPLYKKGNPPYFVKRTGFSVPGTRAIH